MKRLPNAARLFVNWMASREGASLFAPAHGYPSQRLDVSTDSFDPAIVPPPGSVLPDEEYLKALGEIRKVAGSIFHASGK